MRSLRNVNPRDLPQAIAAARDARRDGHAVAYAGGGSDLLGLVKERIINPDVIVHLRSGAMPHQVEVKGGRVRIGGMITLDALSAHPLIRSKYAVLAEAAGSVATPQIRNAATLAGNVCQRPWCWYYRNGFPCLKAGGDRCFSINGENQFHAIFGGGPSFIVHPSDTAPALVALDAKFHIMGSGGERIVDAADFFTLPKQNATRENVLTDDEVLARVEFAEAKGSMRSLYHKVMDREAWTHAIVSAAVVLEIDKGTCRKARIVLGGVAPIPWRVSAVEKMLTGQKITPELAASAAEAAVAGANPLAKNKYKVPLTREIVARGIMQAAARA